MNNSSIFFPLLAQVFLTAMVWAWMYYTRIREMVAKNIPAQSLANGPRARELLQGVAGPSENLINLFELPVLFYVAALTAYVSGAVSTMFIFLAWLYVGLRFVHSVVHITYNNVMHRFAAYFLSTVILWAMWALLAWWLIGMANS